MPRRNERTSPTVAEVAERIVRAKNWDPFLGDYESLHGAWIAIQSVAASALTQAKNKKKKTPPQIVACTADGYRP